MRLARRTRQITALALAFLLCLGSVRAGITITGTDGITTTGTDGIQYVGTSGIVATGTDSYLFFTPNGIATTGTDGIAVTGTDGIATTGTDGVTYTGANGVVATGADSMSITRADGITVTGTDGITVTGTDGTTYHADSVLIRQADGIVATGTDGITAIGTNGIATTGTDTHSIAHADGITVTGTDGLAINRASGITVTGTDGTIYGINPTGITVTGTDGIVATGTDGISVTGTDSFVTRASDFATMIGTDISSRGIRSIDPEFAILLNEMTDDSNVDAIVVFHQKPSDADMADLRNIGVLGGTRYRELPMIALTAKRSQIISISRLPSVRSIYGNRTLQPTVDPYMALTGAERVRRDNDLTKRNIGIPVSGRNVTVAVLDTGLDGTHADLSGRVVQNVKLADTQSVGVGFTEPVSVEGLPNTDQAYGHGTFVAGIIAGSGVRSGGKYGGIAPGANLVGLSAGDLNLSYVLSGFDYLLSRGASLNTRVVNCSFSANTVFDTNDPVNVATRILTDRGVSVVFSAGNTGSGQNTLNPYAVAPWVISVGATNQFGQLANFSSRGDMGSALFRPTLVAPGVDVISLRSTGASVTGTLGVIEADKTRLTASELPFYTSASGTSFSAPQVAGTIALMLEANPRLTPQQIRDILQRTSTPLPDYFQHEVGAGMLNAHAAVLEAAFPERRMGVFRAALDQGQVSFVSEAAQQFNGFVSPLGSYKVNVNVPADALLTSVQAAWGPLSSTSDLVLTVADAGGAKLSSPNTPNQPGLTGKSEGYTVRGSGGGTLRLQLSQALGVGQPALAVMEVTRAEYAPLGDLGGLGPEARADIQQVLRKYLMLPYGKNFRPGFGVTRGELAATLVRGGYVPQYLPGKPRFTDVSDSTTMLFVESVQSAPAGALFTDAQPGGKFRPDDYATRLAAAVALVRAAGLQSETATALLPSYLKDAGEIPTALRGYVAVALDKGLLTAEDGYFHAQSAITRAQLAHSLLIAWRKVN
jgi:serine protease AprX